MLRIYDERQPSEQRHLRLEGSITGPWLVELQRICSSIMRDGAALSLDLSAVTFADTRAVRWLKDQEKLGVSLLGGVGFIAEQLSGDRGRRD
jgi:hypothetical protein